MTTFLGAALDVAIGLALVYLLLGMIASALQETIATLLKWRGKQLRDGITALLSGSGAASAANTLAAKVLGHPLLQGTSSSGLPSYLSARNFTAVLFETLTDGSQAPLFSQIETSVAGLPAGTPGKQSLTALIRQAGGDLDKLTTSVQSWYNDAMDRLSGDYKRWSHYFALGFGLAVAVAFNVDSFKVAETLWLDPQARSAAAAVAEQYVANHKPPQSESTTSVPDLKKQTTDAETALAGMNLPIGWNLTGNTISFGTISATLTTAWNNAFKSDGSGIGLVLSGLATLLGWIATGLAVSLGAPFWFDTLGSLVNLRGAGPKPNDSSQNAPASS